MRAQDRELVARLYRDTLQDAYTQVDRLHYDGLNWGDAEAQQLAHTLKTLVCPRLKILTLDLNKIGTKGAYKVAKAIKTGAAPALKTLSIEDNSPQAKRAIRDAQLAV